jgi:hypothetical protein
VGLDALTSCAVAAFSDLPTCCGFISEGNVNLTFILDPMLTRDVTATIYRSAAPMEEESRI